MSEYTNITQFLGCMPPDPLRGEVLYRAPLCLIPGSAPRYIIIVKTPDHYLAETLNLALVMHWASKLSMQVTLE